MTPSKVPTPSCGELICRLRGWPPEQFVEKAFWKCLQPWAVPFAALLWPLRRRVFAQDFDVLRDIANATTTPEVNSAANSLRHDPRHDPSFIRNSLGIRVSGRRLTALIQEARRTAGNTQAS